MIFITVGTVAPFDDLIRDVDSMADRGIVSQFTAQIGSGAYLPKNGKWYRFKTDLSEDYRASDLVITHTGTGTLFELLRNGSRTIAVPNPDVVQNHEVAIKLGEEGYLIFCERLGELEGKITQAKSWNPKKYVEDPCRIGEVISDFLLGSPKKD